ncbi:MAG: HAMP domain-containing histidine kinase [Treponema sp.]|nr:HAMP domain-containing histidine kinase [Treponema sp.]
MKKKSASVSVPLALRFMLLLAIAMLSLSVLFTVLLTRSVRHKQDSDLEKSIALIADTLTTKGVDELSFLDLAYYVTYAVYDQKSKTVLATNDSLLPLLESEGKSRTYFEKDYFTDSDLNIRYQSRAFQIDKDLVVVECALDIANDSAAQMLAAVPKLALFALLPVLVLSFALSFLISRKTIAAFKKLQEDYDREREFTSNVSHELKTPISIIDGHANLIKRWGKDDPKQLADSISAILRETEHMSSIVTTLLDMSRIENGTLKIEKTLFFAQDLFLRLQDEFGTIHPKLTFHIVGGENVELETDEQKLHQIFTVILSNSLKFAGEQCAITLSAHKNGNKVELSAADNGTGFAEDVLPHVFERFYKGDAAHNRASGGAGLGLSIAQALVRAMGGSIHAGNTENGGAIIKIIL